MVSPSRLLIVLLTAALCQPAIAQPPDFGRGDDRGSGRDRGRDRGGEDRGGGDRGGFSRGGFGENSGSFGGPPGGFPGGFGGPPGGFGGPPSGFGGPPGGFGGPPDPGRFFGFMDRNQDGVLDAEETGRVPSFLRDRMQQAGLSLDKPISREEFSGTMQKVMEQRQQEGDSSRSDRSRTDSRSRSASSTNVKPPAFIRDLPERYRSLDKNSDRQLGLYEWDRANLAEFRKFDLNDDGFLTPPELTLALAQAAKPVAGISADALSIGVGLLSPPDGEDDALREEALATFGRMDNNADGSLDADEWSRSLKVRPMIEEAGIKVKFPIREAQFIASFVEGKKYQP